MLKTAAEKVKPKLGSLAPKIQIYGMKFLFIKNQMYTNTPSKVFRASKKKKQTAFGTFTLHFEPLSKPFPTLFFGIVLVVVIVVFAFDAVIAVVLSSRCGLGVAPRRPTPWQLTMKAFAKNFSPTIL